MSSSMAATAAAALAVAIHFVAAPLSAAAAPTTLFFSVRLIDGATGRGVPAMRLTATSISTYFTDSAGYAAVIEPGLMGTGQQVWFTISGDGYEYPADGFGNRGFMAPITAGGSIVVAVNRTDASERLARFTGYGIYRDSALLGLPTPLPNGTGLINSGVTGLDSTQATVYKGKLHLFFGDTNAVNYPLGQFDTTGAVATPIPLAAVSASAAAHADDSGVGTLALQYFSNGQGFVKGMLPIKAPTPMDGPLWVAGTTTTADGEHMTTVFTKLKRTGDMGMWGVGTWDDDAEQFANPQFFNGTSATELFYNDTMGSQSTHVNASQFAQVFPATSAASGDASNATYVVMTNAYPYVRSLATLEALTNASQWEAFTCLLPGSTLESPKFDRDATTGRVRYSWKHDAPPVPENVQQLWEVLGMLKKGEGILNLTDAASGKRVTLHRSALRHSAARGSWVLVGEDADLSHMGTIWVSEAAKPEGPFRVAHRIASHDETGMNFYNPCVFPSLEALDSNPQHLYFSGTYVNSFTSAPKTPFYDYNNVLHRVDLAAVFDGAR